MAVDNAVAPIKEKADFCTRGAASRGVVELIDELVSTDLAKRAPGGGGDAVLLAMRQDGTPAMFPPYGHNILISGPSGAGKSTFATGLIERLMERPSFSRTSRCEGVSWTQLSSSTFLSVRSGESR